MSYFNHTQHYRQYCFVGNKTEDCKLGLFQDASFVGDLSDSKIKFRRSVVRIGRSHTFVPIAWMNRKQAAVSLTAVQNLKYVL